MVSKKNWQSDCVGIFKTWHRKCTAADKNQINVKLIQQGAVITKANLYQWFEKGYLLK